MPKHVKQLKIGDLVDLQNDEFADPVGFALPDSPSDTCQNNGWESEYATVREIEKETDTCILIYFDNFSCGFPPQHLIKTNTDQ